MKKLFTILMCLSLILLSCCGIPDTSSHPDIVVKLPDGSVADGKTPSSDSINKNNVTVGKPGSMADIYIGNNKTMKFHLKDCAWAKKIKAENIVQFSNYNEYINSGYSPCKTCNP